MLSGSWCISLFLYGLPLRFTKPQVPQVLRLAEALMVSDARHKTLAGWYRLRVAAPDPSQGADTLRLSPGTAEDLRAPMRRLRVTDWVASAQQTAPWTL